VNLPKESSLKGEKKRKEVCLGKRGEKRRITKRVKGETGEENSSVTTTSY